MEVHQAEKESSCDESHSLVFEQHVTDWNRRMQCQVAMATYIAGEAKRAWPKRSGGNAACPVVWGVAVRFRHLPDS